jgi:hypothetical protein
MVGRAGRKQWQVRNGIGERVGATARRRHRVRARRRRQPSPGGHARSLLEAHVTVDAIVGTLIGALNGAFLAGHPGLNGREKLA